MNKQPKYEDKKIASVLNFQTYNEKYLIIGGDTAYYGDKGYTYYCICIDSTKEAMIGNDYHFDARAWSEHNDNNIKLERKKVDKFKIKASLLIADESHYLKATIKHTDSKVYLLDDLNENLEDDDLVLVTTSEKVFKKSYFSYSDYIKLLNVQNELFTNSYSNVFPEGTKISSPEDINRFRESCSKEIITLKKRLFSHNFVLFGEFENAAESQEITSYKKLETSDFNGEGVYIVINKAHEKIVNTLLSIPSYRVRQYASSNRKNKTLLTINQFLDNYNAKYHYELHDEYIFLDKGDFAIRLMSGEKWKLDKVEFDDKYCFFDGSFNESDKSTHSSPFRFGNESQSVEIDEWWNFANSETTWLKVFN